MKRALPFIFLLFSSFLTFAQVDTSDKNPVFADAAVMPQFPGGEDSLRAYIHRNVEYFFEFHMINFSGKAYISFTVESNGRVKDVRILQTSGYAKIDKEIIRVFNRMPKWIPGKDNEKAVGVYMYLMVDIYPE
jgi:protein TonB